jgi:antibiotic biosynthesis monooxygenase (ABM) superfamily enzyme
MTSLANMPNESPSAATNAVPKSPVPSRHRIALLTLVGVYPLITAILYVVLPLTDGWAIWQRTLVVAPAMVAVITYGMMPAIQTYFRGFLMGRRAVA